MRGMVWTILGGSLVILLLSEACSPPVPLRITEDTKRIQQIDSLLDNLRESLQAKDLTALAGLLPPDRQQDITALSEIMPSLDVPRLDFFIDRIVLEEDTATVALHWEFRWDQVSLRPDEPRSRKHRGNAVFRLQGDQDLHLVAVEGDNPFLAPLTEKVLPQ